MSQEPEANSSETAVPEAPRDMSTPPPEETPAFGWTAYAERVNGRFAMIGFVALLVLEFFTHQDFFTWIGLFR